MKSTYEEYQKNRIAFLSTIFTPEYDVEKKKWLESVGIIKRGAVHGLILQRDERLIDLSHEEKPSFLGKILTKVENITTSKHQGKN